MFNKIRKWVINYWKDLQVYFRTTDFKWTVEAFLFVLILLCVWYIGYIARPKPKFTITHQCPSVTCEAPIIDGFVIPSARIEAKYNIENLRFERIHLKSVRLTAYNNHPNQTSSSPNTFASGRIVYEGGVAISQDILDKYQLKYGDLVFIPKMNKYYVYEDKMAYGRKDGERTIKNTVDIFMFSYDTAKTFHYPSEEVIIYKFARNQ